MVRGFLAALAALFACAPASAEILLERTDPVGAYYTFNFELGPHYLIEMSSDSSALLTWDGNMDLRSRLVDPITGAIVFDNFSDSQLGFGGSGYVVSTEYFPRIPAPRMWADGLMLVYYIGSYGIHAGFYALGDGGTFTTRISTIEVPEPATWALLILGFGITGAVSRARRGASASRSA